MVQAMADLAAAARACRDRSCAERVNANIEALHEVADAAPGEVSEDDMRVVMVSMFEAIGCLGKRGI